MNAAKPVGGKIVNFNFILLSILSLIGIYFIVDRFSNGIGAVSNLSDLTPWGLWITLDVIIGTALACGGYSMAFIVYIMNGAKFHKLMRPAFLASLLGYSFASFGIMIDAGRYWNLFLFGVPTVWQTSSVLLEVGVCIISYNLVLGVEFLPSILEKFSVNSGLARTISSLLEKLLFVIIGIGILLPTMHQSGLGGLMILTGHKLDPLWQSNLIPLLFVISSFGCGFGVVIIEGMISSKGFNHKFEFKLYTDLAKIMTWVFTVFFGLRIFQVVTGGGLAGAFSGSLKSISFLVEMVLFAVSIGLLWKQQRTRSPRTLFLAGVLILVASSLYRVNVFVIGFNPIPGIRYFPSVPELLITVGLVAMELLLFVAIVKIFPVFSSDHKGS
ncbi:MAG: Ni/Fe-hydrogenase cytochrome b subunit [SAR324 cluster bacterium]|nr:Ni/Fe-hydrogenase cytochrome b subunit [SAR324 cluster bacterium]